ncbi:MAG: hypothetical protein EAZ07_01615 [Cytophagales bacterium]|nr:MAG: hypothetical protein EAZ07_01615 [Cytophagales bacterium]
MKFSNLVFIFIILYILIACKPDPQTESLSDAQASFKDLEYPELNFLNASIEEEPNDAALYFKRAKFYFKIGKTNSALNDANKAIQIDNVKPNYYFLLAQIYNKLGKTNLAINSAKKSEILNNKEVELLLLLSNTYLTLRDSSNAYQYYLKAREISPNHADISLIEGRFIQLSKDTIAGIPYFLKALEANNEHESAVEHISMAYYKKNNEDSTLFFLLRGIKKYPYNPFFQFQMGNVFLKNKLYKSALQCYYQSIEIDSNYVNATKKIADINLYNSNFIDALKWYIFTLNQTPNDISTNIKIAEILEKLGKEQDAIPYYRNITILDPNNSEAKSKYEKLILLYPLAAPPSSNFINDTLIAKSSIDTLKKEPPKDTIKVVKKRRLPKIKPEVKEISEELQSEEVPSTETENQE